MNEFYAGQQLSGCLRSLDGAHWLKTTKKHSPQTAKKAGIKEVKVTVEAVSGHESQTSDSVLIVVIISSWPVL